MRRSRAAWLATGAAVSMLAGAGVVQAAPGGYARLSSGTATVTAHGDGLLHVAAVLGGAPAPATSRLVVAAPPAVATRAVTVTERPGHLLLRAARDSPDIDLATGAVSFADAGGKPFLRSAGPPRFTRVTVDGKPLHQVSQQWNQGSNEGLYGLGQHRNAVMNGNGEDLELVQHNMDIAVPFLASLSVRKSK